MKSRILIAAVKMLIMQVSEHVYIISQGSKRAPLFLLKRIFDRVFLPVNNLDCVRRRSRTKSRCKSTPRGVKYQIANICACVILMLMLQEQFTSIAYHIYYSPFSRRSLSRFPRASVSLTAATINVVSVVQPPRFSSPSLSTIHPRRVSKLPLSRVYAFFARTGCPVAISGVALTTDVFGDIDSAIFNGRSHRVH